MLLVFLHNPPILWYENVSTLAIATNLIFHAQTKHIVVDYHFVRERVLRHDLQAKFVSSHDQLADILTKGLGSPLFCWMISKLMWCFPMALRGDEKQKTIDDFDEDSGNSVILNINDQTHRITLNS